jgi:hypothetical protein
LGRSVSAVACSICREFIAIQGSVDALGLGEILINWVGGVILDVARTGAIDSEVKEGGAVCLAAIVVVGSTAVSDNG